MFCSAKYSGFLAEQMCSNRHVLFILTCSLSIGHFISFIGNRVRLRLSILEGVMHLQLLSDTMTCFWMGGP